MFWRDCLLSGILLWLGVCLVDCEDVPVSCGGFIKADFPVDFTKIQIKLYTVGGALRDSTDCAPNIGYFLIPLYDKGEFVLKVEGPPGWKTEPSEVTVMVDGETDICSRGEDINFKLLGFSVVGQVVSVGSEVGPMGVALQLKQDGSTVHTTTSTEEGRFLFEGVAPGLYSLEASHELWTLSKAAVKVTVTDGSYQVPAHSLVLSGFNVKGQVASDGDPIPGVQFLLFPEPGQKIDCEVGDSPLSHGGRSPSCIAVSDATGLFTFPRLPPGHYHLVPHYRQNDIDFKVHPAEAEFDVLNDTVLLETVFEVQGFSVSGQVLRTVGGDGVGGARVYVDGEEVTTTDPQGHYQLMDVTTGRYNIRIETPAEMLEFAEIQVYLSPSDPSIPVITPAKYGVCGQVTITHPPPSTQTTARSVQVLTTTSPPVAVETVAVDTQSKFCTLLPLGDYTMKVVVTKEESAHGLVVLPGEMGVPMREGPLPPSTLIVFKQYLATLSGSVTCLGECPGDIEVSLRRNTGKGQQLTAKVTPSGKKGKFSFSDVLPGSVKISVSYPQWCWGAESVNIEVSTDKQKEMVFKQSGYSMPYTVSHDTPVTYLTGNASGTEATLSGSGHLCLDKSGVYKILPKSCHKFKKDVYKFDTSSPERLVLEAQEHYVNVSVLAEQRDESLSVTVRSLRFGSKKQVLKSLTVAKQQSADHQSQTFKYSFSFLAEPQDEVEISPASSELMFSPPSRVVTVSTDCPEEVSSFLGSPGLMVVGRVQPAIGGVAISIRTEEDGLISTSTDSQGEYRAGPLRGGKQLTVTAEKVGYTFEPLSDDPRSFKALKLSKIVIKVTSGDGSPLSNVLVSLSGANFRSNNFTSEEGTVAYLRLNPGQYYIKALLREFDFQPSSKVIELAQGGSEEIVFIATRVAFSCSGRVTTLNRQPLEGVLVRAAGSGVGECGSYGVDSPTDPAGEYRLRGLVPGCDYTLSVELGGEIDRTLPVRRVITVGIADIEGMEFVAMLRTTQIFITGNVKSDHKHFMSLKAQLSRGSSVLSSVPVDTAGFFDFPSQAPQDEGYVVSLESTLFGHSYNLTKGEKSVPGDKDSHVTLVFTAEEIPSSPDSQRGSVFALIIAVIIVFALVNVDKVFLVVQSVVAGQRDSISSSGTETRRKTGRKR